MIRDGIEDGKVIEIENGDVTGWRREDKIDVAHQLLRAAEELLRDDPEWAYGATLLSLYLEAQAVSGVEAQRIVSRIRDWYWRTAEKEFHLSLVGSQ